MAVVLLSSSSSTCKFIYDSSSLAPKPQFIKAWKQSYTTSQCNSIIIIDKRTVHTMIIIIIMSQFNISTPLSLEDIAIDFQSRLVVLVQEAISLLSVQFLMTVLKELQYGVFLDAIAKSH